ncbi:hypothetical protein E4U41_003731 [Claviceps citrina]|nr:hypothetical protein E4U41_003731 [Claviceps citrina]
MSRAEPLEHIDAVDAFARTLFVRVKASSSPLLAEVATPVRQLHIALRHLRVEAADPDSLLRRGDASVYARQLGPIVQDCEHALKQLEAVLERSSAAHIRDPEDLAGRVAAVQSRIASETTSIDMFLDTVQLHNPANNAPQVLVHAKDADLEHIKDKVDNIAKGLFLPRDSSGGASVDEDQMWQVFKSKLEGEGFSPRVLRQHKDILRAYIRELQSMSAANGGAPPTVRGLLEHEAMSHRYTPPVPPKEPLSPVYSKGPRKKKSHPDADDDKPGLSMTRRMPDRASSSLSSRHEANFPCSSEDASNKEGGEPSDSLALALISTEDLVAMDDMNSRLAGMHLHPAAASYFSAQQMKRGSDSLPSGMAGSWPPPHVATAGQPGQSLMAKSPSRSPSMTTRLAPDRYGKEIPPDAAWTKVKRSLVSPEVLQRAGVRYEARPDYVAILGRLSRDEVAEYARQSANCRAARSAQGHAPPPRAHPRGSHSHRHRADSKSSSENKDDDDDDDDDDDGSVLWDESDSTDHDDDKSSERGTRSQPYIVSPPNESQRRASSSAAVRPKPILKNKNEHHVRFAPEPHEVQIEGPRSYDGAYGLHDGRREDGGARRRRRHHHHHHRDGGRRDDRARSGEYYRSSRHADRLAGEGDRRRDHHRPRREERERERERHTRRRTWGETIGVVGIGGAAASLLGVLAEAAVGM